MNLFGTKKACHMVHDISNMGTSEGTWVEMTKSHFPFLN